MHLFLMARKRPLYVSRHVACTDRLAFLFPSNPSTPGVGGEETVAAVLFPTSLFETGFFLFHSPSKRKVGRCKCVLLLEVFVLPASGQAQRSEGSCILSVGFSLSGALRGVRVALHDGVCAFLMEVRRRSYGMGGGGEGDQRRFRVPEHVSSVLLPSFPRRARAAWPCSARLFLRQRTTVASPYLAATLFGVMRC